jgi:thiamine-monophosphate kinase
LAAFAVNHLVDDNVKHSKYAAEIQKALHQPTPRTDYRLILREYATAAIDISDGLLADLNHICQASRLGACLSLDAIPIHPLLSIFNQNPLEFALTGGDDYELCFTISAAREALFLDAVKENGLICYKIGVMDATTGLRALNHDQHYVQLKAKGYAHF